ncbi:MAG: hypothetical protein ABI477_22425, partial [Chryseolinea sp.]
ESAAEAFRSMCGKPPGLEAQFRELKMRVTHVVATSGTITGGPGWKSCRQLKAEGTFDNRTSKFNMPQFIFLSRDATSNVVIFSMLALLLG